MTQLEAFGDEFARLAKTSEQKVLAEAFGEFVADEAHTAIRYIAEVTRQHGPVGSGPQEKDRQGIAATAQAAIPDSSHRAQYRRRDHDRDARPLTPLITAFLSAQFPQRRDETTT